MAPCIPSVRRSNAELTEMKQARICPICRRAIEQPILMDDAIFCVACNWVMRRRGRCWLSDSHPEPEGFDASAVERLRLMDNHFWSRGRRQVVKRLLSKIGQTGPVAIELGCGTGTLLDDLEMRFERVLAVDGYSRLLADAEAASKHSELYQSEICATPLPAGNADLIVMLDVIEHVDPDALLAEAYRLARRGGKLLIAAPAAPCLWSGMDVAAGHRCRYTRALLETELSRNGWQPLGTTYYQALLFPLLWLRVKLGLRTTGGLERSPPGWLDRVLGLVNAMEIQVSKLLPMPFGSSIFVWAERRDG
jgi:SAM-dependent methyltransferase